jgi:hypothetical protein
VLAVEARRSPRCPSLSNAGNRYPAAVKAVEGDRVAMDLHALVRRVLN